MEVTETTTETTTETPNLKVGIYGWRKRCLYSVILVMMVLVLCNLAATLLVISALNFNPGGLGALSISAGGVFLRDISHVLDSLVTSHMSSRHGHPLTLEASYNMSAIVWDSSRHKSQVINFWSSVGEANHQEVTATASQFQVSDLTGKVLFTSDGHRVNVGADILKVLEGGVHLSGGVQTSMLRSALGNDLMLESATRRLYMLAPGGVAIESRAADVSASCFSNLQLASSNGQVQLKAKGIYIPNLESVNLQRPQPSPLRTFNSEGGPMPMGYQVCMCTNGKLFAAHPEGECRVDGDNTQCRSV